VPPAPVRRQRSLGLTVLVAAITALVVAAGTALATTWFVDRDTPAATVSVPVVGSSTVAPDWERVAVAVQASVVAIAVTTSDGDGEGSGVIISADGDVLTNNHVVQGADDDTVAVTLFDGRIYPAEIVGLDPTTDLAVVRLTDAPANLSPAVLGDSSTVAVGQQVLAAGNPLGLQNTMTTGIVSAVNRPAVTAMTTDSSDVVVTNAIQVDAAVNPGNSGGPVFDGEGKVIGITSSIATLAPAYGSARSGSIGLGFAIPVNLAKKIADQLIDSGSAKHAFLGVRMNDALVTAEGVTRRGAQVTTVSDGSPASEAGLRVGDVIVAFNHAPTPGAESLTAYVRSQSAGDRVTLTVVRDGRSMNIDATLAVRAETATPPSQPTPTPTG